MLSVLSDFRIATDLHQSFSGGKFLWWLSCLWFAVGPREGNKSVSSRGAWSHRATSRSDSENVSCLSQQPWTVDWRQELDETFVSFCFSFAWWEYVQCEKKSVLNSWWPKGGLLQRWPQSRDTAGKTSQFPCQWVFYWLWLYKGSPAAASHLSLDSAPCPTVRYNKSAMKGQVSSTGHLTSNLCSGHPLYLWYSSL